MVSESFVLRYLAGISIAIVFSILIGFGNIITLAGLEQKIESIEKSGD